MESFCCLTKAQRKSQRHRLPCLKREEILSVGNFKNGICLSEWMNQTKPKNWMKWMHECTKPCRWIILCRGLSLSVEGHFFPMVLVSGSMEGNRLNKMLPRAVHRGSCVCTTLHTVHSILLQKCLPCRNVKEVMPAFFCCVQYPSLKGVRNFSRAKGLGWLKLFL